MILNYFSYDKSIMKFSLKNKKKFKEAKKKTFFQRLNFVCTELSLSGFTNINNLS